MCIVFFFQAEDGIRDLVRSRGLGDVYKRQAISMEKMTKRISFTEPQTGEKNGIRYHLEKQLGYCLLYTSDAADERSSVDLGGRRIIKKKKEIKHSGRDSRSLQSKKNNMTENGTEKHKPKKNLTQ